MFVAATPVAAVIKVVSRGNRRIISLSKVYIEKEFKYVVLNFWHFAYRFAGAC